MSLTKKNPPNNDSQSVHVKNPLPIFLLAVIILIAVGGVMYLIDIKTNDLRMGKTRVVDNSSESLASRLQPVAKFALLVPEQGDVALKTGQEVYEATCTTCHAAGVAGAPIFGNKDAWAPFIKAGYEDMLNVALHGRGAMPAKGGNTALKDIEVERAMVYMANAGGADYAEPKADEAAPEGEETKTAASEQPVVDDPTTTEPVEVASTKTAETEPETKAETATATAETDAKEPEPADAAAKAETAVAEAGGIPAATEEQLAIGKKIYDSACVACHSTGVANAPKFGDKADWAPYIETGMDTMLQIAIAGKGAMPPRGTAMNASDEDLRATILYMIQDAR